MSQQDVNVNMKAAEIYRVLRCKKCKKAFRELIRVKLKEARELELDKQVDQMLEVKK